MVLAEDLAEQQQVAGQVFNRLRGLLLRHWVFLQVLRVRKVLLFQELDRVELETLDGLNEHLVHLLEHLPLRFLTVDLLQDRAYVIDALAFLDGTQFLSLHDPVK